MRKLWSSLRCSIVRMLSAKMMLTTVLSSMLYVTLLPYVHADGIGLEEVLLTYVGGFEYEEIIYFKLDQIFVWALMLLSYFWCVAIAMQEEYDGRCRDTLYRFSSYKRWYGSKVLAAWIACVGITLLIVIGGILSAFLWGKGRFGAVISDISGFYGPIWKHVLVAMLLLTCNALMLTAWQMLVHLLTGSIVAATAAFLLPIVVSLYACSNDYLNPITNQWSPINWGMYLRSEAMSDLGVPILRAVIGQLGIALLCGGLGMAFAGKVNMAGRMK